MDRSQFSLKTEWDVLPDYCLNGTQDAQLAPVSLFGVGNSGIILLDLPLSQNIMYVQWQVDISDSDSDIYSIARIPERSDIPGSFHAMERALSDLSSFFAIEIQDTLVSLAGVQINAELDSFITLSENTKMKLSYSVPFSENESEVYSFVKIPESTDIVSVIQIAANERNDFISLAHIFNFEDIDGQMSVPNVSDIASSMQVQETSNLNLVFNVPVSDSEADVFSSVTIPYKLDTLSVAWFKENGEKDFNSIANLQIFDDLASGAGILLNFEFPSKVSLTSLNILELKYVNTQIPTQIYKTDVAMDSYTTQSSMYYNAGDKHFVSVGNDIDSKSPTVRAYLQFDISRIAELIVNDCEPKSLNLYLPSYSNLSGYTLKIYAYDHRWQEMGITWANQYALKAQDLLLEYEVPATNQAFIEIPVEEAVLKAVQGGKKVWSIVICSSKPFTFSSKEGGNPARLIFKYVDPYWDGQFSEAEITDEVEIIPVTGIPAEADIWHDAGVASEADLVFRMSGAISVAHLYNFSDIVSSAELEQADFALPSSVQVKIHSNLLSSVHFDPLSYDLHSTMFLYNKDYDINVPSPLFRVEIEPLKSNLDSEAFIYEDSAPASWALLEWTGEHVSSIVQVVREQNLNSEASIEPRTVFLISGADIWHGRDMLSDAEISPVLHDIASRVLVPHYNEIDSTALIEFRMLDIASKADILISNGIPSESEIEFKAADMPSSVLIEWTGEHVVSEASVFTHADQLSGAFIEWHGAHVTGEADVIEVRDFISSVEIEPKSFDINSVVSLDERQSLLSGEVSIHQHENLVSSAELEEITTILSGATFKPLDIDVSSSMEIDEPNKSVFSEIRIQQEADADLLSSAELDNATSLIESKSLIVMYGESSFISQFEGPPNSEIYAELYIPKYDIRELNPSIIDIQRDDISDNVSHVFVDDSSHDDRLVSEVTLFRIDIADVSSSVAISNLADSGLLSEFSIKVHANLPSSAGILINRHLLSTAGIYISDDIVSDVLISPRSELGGYANLSESRQLMLTYLTGQIPIRVVNCPVVQDAYVSPSRPYLNYGDASYVSITSDEDSGRGFYTVDFTDILSIPDLGWIEKIEFEVLSQYGLKNDQWFAFYQQDWYWNELSITHANRPYTGTFMQYGDYVSTGRTGGVIRFDITESFMHVLESIWYGYKWGNTFSFDIVSNYPVTFASKESKNPPRIRIYYKEWDWTGEVGLSEIYSAMRIQRSGSDEFVSRADIVYTSEIAATVSVESKPFDFNSLAYLNSLSPSGLVSKVYTESHGMSFDSEVYVTNTFGESIVFSDAFIRLDDVVGSAEIDQKASLFLSVAHIRRDNVASSAEIEFKGNDLQSELQIPAAKDLFSRADVVYTADLPSNAGIAISETYVGFEIHAHFPQSLILSGAIIFNFSELDSMAEIIYGSTLGMASEASIDLAGNEAVSSAEIFHSQDVVGHVYIPYSPTLYSKAEVDERNVSISGEAYTTPYFYVPSVAELEFKGNDAVSETFVVQGPYIESSGTVVLPADTSIPSVMFVSADFDLISYAGLPLVQDINSQIYIYEDLALISYASTGVESQFPAVAHIYYGNDAEGFAYLLDTFVSTADIWHGKDLASSVELEFAARDMQSFVRVMQSDASDMVSRFNTVTAPAFDIELDTVPPEFEASIDVSHWTPKAPFVYVTVNILNCEDKDDLYAYQIKFDGFGFIPTLSQPCVDAPGWYVNQKIFRLRTLLDGPMYLQVRVRDDVWNEAEHSPVFREYFPLEKDFSEHYVPYLDLELDTTPPVPRVVLNGGAEELWDSKLFFEFFDIPDDMTGWKIWSEDFLPGLHMPTTYEDAQWLAVVDTFISACSVTLGLKRFHLAFTDDVDNVSFLDLEIKCVPHQVEGSDAGSSVSATVIDLAVYRKYKAIKKIVTEIPVRYEPRAFEVFNKEFNTFDNGLGAGFSIIFPYAFDNGTVLDIPGSFVIEDEAVDLACAIADASCNTLGYDFGKTAFEFSCTGVRTDDLCPAVDFLVSEAMFDDSGSSEAYAIPSPKAEDSGTTYEESGNIVWAEDRFKNYDRFVQISGIEYDIASAWGEAMQESPCADLFHAVDSFNDIRTYAEDSASAYDSFIGLQSSIGDFLISFEETSIEAPHADIFNTGWKIITDLPAEDSALSFGAVSVSMHGKDDFNPVHEYLKIESRVYKAIKSETSVAFDIPVSDALVSLDSSAMELLDADFGIPREWIPVREFIERDFWEHASYAISEHPLFDQSSIVEAFAGDIPVSGDICPDEHVKVEYYRYLHREDEGWECAAVIRYTPFERTPELRVPFKRVDTTSPLYPRRPIRPFEPGYPEKMQNVESPHYPTMTIRNPEWGQVIRRGSPEFPKNYTESDSISFFKTISYSIMLGERTYQPEYKERQVYDLYGEPAGIIWELEDIEVMLNTGVYLISVEYDPLLSEFNFQTEILPDEHELYLPYRKTSGFYHVYSDNTKMIFRNKFMTDTDARPSYRVKIQSFAFLESDFYKKCKPYWVIMKRPSVMHYYSDPLYPTYRKFNGDPDYPKKLTYSDQRELVDSGNFEFFLNSSEKSSAISFRSNTVTLHSPGNPLADGTYDLYVNLSNYSGGIGISVKQGSEYLQEESGRFTFRITRDNNDEWVTARFTDIRTESENDLPSASYTLYLRDNANVYSVVDAYSWAVWVKTTTEPYTRYDDLLLPDGTEPIWVPVGTDPLIVQNPYLAIDGLYSVDIYYNRSCVDDPFDSLRDSSDPEMISIYQEISGLYDNIGWITLHDAGENNQHIGDFASVEVPVRQFGFYDELYTFGAADGEKLLTDEATACEAVLMYSDINTLDSNLLEEYLVYPEEEGFPWVWVSPGDSRYPHKWIMPGEPEYPTKIIQVQKDYWIYPEDPDYVRFRYKNPEYGDPIQTYSQGTIELVREDGFVNDDYKALRSPYVYEPQKPKDKVYESTIWTPAGWGSTTSVKNPYYGIPMYPDDPDYPHDLYPDDKPVVYPWTSSATTTDLMPGVDFAPALLKNSLSFSPSPSKEDTHSFKLSPSVTYEYSDNPNRDYATLIGSYSGYTHVRTKGDETQKYLISVDDGFLLNVYLLDSEKHSYVLVASNVSEFVFTGGNTYELEPSGHFMYDYDNVPKKEIAPGRVNGYYPCNGHKSLYTHTVTDKVRIEDYDYWVWVQAREEFVKYTSQCTVFRSQYYASINIRVYEPRVMRGSERRTYDKTIDIGIEDKLKTLDGTFSLYGSIQPPYSMEVQVPDGDKPIIKWLGTEPVYVPKSDHAEYIKTEDHLGGRTGVEAFDFYLNRGCDFASFDYVLADPDTSRINIPMLRRRLEKYSDVLIASEKCLYAADPNPTEQYATIWNIPTLEVPEHREYSAIVGEVYKTLLDTAVPCTSVLAYSLPEQWESGKYNLPYRPVFPGEPEYPTRVILPGQEEYPTKVVRPGDIGFPTHVVPNDLYGKPIMPGDYDYPKEGEEGCTGEPIEPYEYTSFVYRYRFYGNKSSVAYSAYDNAIGLQPPYGYFGDYCLLVALDEKGAESFVYPGSALYQEYGKRDIYWFKDKAYLPTLAVYQSIFKGVSSYQIDEPLLKEGDRISVELVSFKENANLYPIVTDFITQRGNASFPLVIDRDYWASDRSWQLPESVPSRNFSYSYSPSDKEYAYDIKLIGNALYSGNRLDRIIDYPYTYYADDIASYSERSNIHLMIAASLLSEMFSPVPVIRFMRNLDELNSTLKSFKQFMSLIDDRNRSNTAYACWNQIPGNYIDFNVIIDKAVKNPVYAEHRKKFFNVLDDFEYVIIPDGENPIYVPRGSMPLQNPVDSSFAVGLSDIHIFHREDCGLAPDYDLEVFGDSSTELDRFIQSAIELYSGHVRFMTAGDSDAVVESVASEIPVSKQLNAKESYRAYRGSDFTVIDRASSCEAVLRYESGIVSRFEIPYGTTRFKERNPLFGKPMKSGDPDYPAYGGGVPIEPFVQRDLQYVSIIPGYSKEAESKLSMRPSNFSQDERLTGAPQAELPYQIVLNCWNHSSNPFKSHKIPVVTITWEDVHGRKLQKTVNWTNFPSGLVVPFANYGKRNIWVKVYIPWNDPEKRPILSSSLINSHGYEDQRPIYVSVSGKLTQPEIASQYTRAPFVWNTETTKPYLTDHLEEYEWIDVAFNMGCVTDAFYPVPNRMDELAARLAHLSGRNEGSFREGFAGNRVYSEEYAVIHPHGIEKPSPSEVVIADKAPMMLFEDGYSCETFIRTEPWDYKANGIDFNSGGDLVLPLYTYGREPFSFVAASSCILTGEEWKDAWKPHASMGPQYEYAGREFIYGSEPFSYKNISLLNPYDGAVSIEDTYNNIDFKIRLSGNDFMWTDKEDRRYYSMLADDSIRINLHAWDWGATSENTTNNLFFALNHKLIFNLIFDRELFDGIDSKDILRIEIPLYESGIMLEESVSDSLLEAGLNGRDIHYSWRDSYTRIVPVIHESTMTEIPLTDVISVIETHAIIDIAITKEVYAIIHCIREILVRDVGEIAGAYRTEIPLSETVSWYESAVQDVLLEKHLYADDRNNMPYCFTVYDEGTICEWVQIVKYNFIIPWYECEPLKPKVVIPPKTIGKSLIPNENAIEYYRGQSCIGDPPGGWMPIEREPEPPTWTPANPKSGLVIWKYAGDPNAMAEPGKAPANPRKQPIPEWAFVIRRTDTGRVVKPQIKNGLYEERYEANPKYGYPISPSDDDYPYAKGSPNYGKSIMPNDPMYDSLRTPEILVWAALTSDDPSFTYWRTNAYGYVNVFLEPGEYEISEPQIKSPWTAKSATSQIVSISNTYERVTVEFFNDAPQSEKDKIPPTPGGSGTYPTPPKKGDNLPSSGSNKQDPADKKPTDPHFPGGYGKPDPENPPKGWKAEEIAGIFKLKIEKEVNVGIEDPKYWDELEFTVTNMDTKTFMTVNTSNTPYVIVSSKKIRFEKDISMWFDLSVSSVKAHVTESRPPAGYSISDANKKGRYITFTKSLKTASLIFKDTKDIGKLVTPKEPKDPAYKFKLSIYKTYTVDGKGPAKPLAGALFSVYFPDTGERMEISTGSNGYANLEIGSIFEKVKADSLKAIVSEKSAPAGYSFDAEPKEVTCTLSRKSAKVEFTNDKEGELEKDPPKTFVPVYPTAPCPNCSVECEVLRPEFYDDAIRITDIDYKIYELYEEKVKAGVFKAGKKLTRTQAESLILERNELYPEESRKEIPKYLDSTGVRESFEGTKSFSAPISMDPRKNGFVSVIYDFRERPCWLKLTSGDTVLDETGSQKKLDMKAADYHYVQDAGYFYIEWDPLNPMSAPMNPSLMLSLKTPIVSTSLGSPICATDFDYPYVPDQDMYGNPVYPEVEITNANKDVRFSDGTCRAINEFEFAKSHRSPQSREYFFRTDNALPFRINIDHKSGGDAMITVYQKYPDYEMKDGYRWVTLQVISYTSKTKSALITPTTNGDGTYKIVVRNNNISMGSFIDPGFDWAAIPKIVDYITVTQEVGKHKNPAYTRNTPVNANALWHVEVHTGFGSLLNPNWKRNEQLFELILGTIYVPAECTLPDEDFDSCYDRYGRPEPCHPVPLPDPPEDIEFPKKPEGQYYYSNENPELTWNGTIDLLGTDSAVSYYRHWYALGLYMEMHELVLGVKDPKHRFNFLKGFKFREHELKIAKDEPLRLGYKDVLGIRKKPNDFKFGYLGLGIRFLEDAKQLRLDAGEPLKANAFEDFFIRPSDQTGVYSLFPPVWVDTYRHGLDEAVCLDALVLEKTWDDEAVATEHKALIETDSDDLVISAVMTDPENEFAPVTESTSLGFKVQIHSRWRGAEIFIKDGYGYKHVNSVPESDFLIHEEYEDSGNVTLEVKSRRWAYGDHVLMCVAADRHGNIAEAFVPFTVVKSSVSLAQSEIDKETGVASYTTGTSMFQNALCMVKSYKVEVPTLPSHSGNDTLSVSGIKSNGTMETLIELYTSNGGYIEGDSKHTAWNNGNCEYNWMKGTLLPEDQPVSIQDGVYPNPEKFTKLRFEYKVGNVNSHLACLDRANEGMLCEIEYTIGPSVIKQIEKDFKTWEKSLGLPRKP